MALGGLQCAVQFKPESISSFHLALSKTSAIPFGIMITGMRSRGNMNFPAATQAISVMVSFFLFLYGLTLTQQ